MARHPEPQRTQLDGVEMVLLTQDAYERLEAARRQGGAQANRIRSLSQKLSDATAFLDDLERAVAELPVCQLGHSGSCRKVETGPGNRS